MNILDLGKERLEKINFDDPSLAGCQYDMTPVCRNPASWQRGSVYCLTNRDIDGYAHEGKTIFLWHVIDNIPEFEYLPIIDKASLFGRCLSIEDVIREEAAGRMIKGATAIAIALTL